MANPQNLIPQAHVLTVEEMSRGGNNSVKARREKATMLSTLEKLLDEKNNASGKTYRELATLGLIKGAVNGSSKNYEIIQQLMERKEEKEQEQDVIVVIPAKDIASSFNDINRDIDIDLVLSTKAA